MATWGVAAAEVVPGAVAGEGVGAVACRHCLVDFEYH